MTTERLITLSRHRAEQRLGDPERWQELLQGYAFGRAARPREIADMVAFLASDRSGYTTGINHGADGREPDSRSTISFGTRNPLKRLG